VCGSCPLVISTRLIFSSLDFSAFEFIISSKPNNNVIFFFSQSEDIFSGAIREVKEETGVRI
jgi:hypothetical protein